MSLTCHNCHNTNSFHTLVSGGSYYFQCANCHTHNVATSFMAIGPELKGNYDIIEVDSEMNEIKRLATGEIANHYEMIRKEAHQGKIIWLKKI